MRRIVVVLAGLALTLVACRPATQEDRQASSGPGWLNREDELLLAAANIALPPPGVTPPGLPEPQSRGAQLVAKHCAQCHFLPSPAMHSATDWPGVVRRMWLRMEWLPPSLGVKVPSIPERFAMLDFLTANALKVSGEILPAGRGRDEFALVCSRCHALPDPRVHSAQDWPTVFARMEQNIVRMKMPPLTQSQTANVLLYLREVTR